MPHTPAHQLAEEWENEGGSVRPAPEARSAGLDRILTERYAVGGRSYGSLTEAIAGPRSASLSGVGR